MRVRGFGHHIASLMAQPSKAQMSRGGSAALARALEARSAKLAARSAPDRAAPHRGREQPRRGDRDRGRRGHCDARHGVASSLNPQQTFLELLDEAHMPREVRAQCRRTFKYNLIAPLFALNLNLREPPRYAVAEARPELDRGFMVVMGLDHVDQFSDVIRHHEAGTLPPTIMWGACPTRFDPTQAPPGRHTAFMWEKTALSAQRRSAELGSARAKTHGGDDARAVARHAPNLADAVIDSFTRSPLDVERSLPNMRAGRSSDRRFHRGQIGYNRPFPGAGPVPQASAGSLPVRIE